MKLIKIYTKLTFDDILSKIEHVPTEQKNSFLI
jgi:hypothetical protein